MPNANTSGINQPLNQHLVPRHEIYSVAQDIAIFADLLLASGDTLVVPPPVAGGARIVDADGIAALAIGAGTDTGTIVLVYKDGDGNEVILGSVNAGPGAQVFGAGIVLMPSDLGLYVRVTSNPPAGSIAVTAKWDDVRNIVSRENVELTTSFQDILPFAPDGNTLFPGQFGEESDGTYAWFFNLDSADRTVEVQITDGTTTFLFSTVPVTTLTNLDFATVSTLRSTPEVRVRARITTDAGQTGPVICQVPLSAHNQGPARQDQGGAY